MSTLKHIFIIFIMTYTNFLLPLNVPDLLFSPVFKNKRV